jgi:hypothetical protein
MDDDYEDIAKKRTKGDHSEVKINGLKEMENDYLNKGPSNVDMTIPLDLNNLINFDLLKYTFSWVKDLMNKQVNERNQMF